MTLSDLLDDLPAVAVHTLAADVSRADLTASADHLAAVLTDCGLMTGQVVAAMLPNDATTVAALFGVWHSGGVYTPLNPRAADAEVAAQLETLEPVAVITTPELAHRFSEFALPVVTGSSLAWSLAPHSTSADEAQRYDPDVALLQFTSGTTGPPKPVPLRHSTVLDLTESSRCIAGSSNPSLRVRRAKAPVPTCRGRRTSPNASPCHPH